MRTPTKFLAIALSVALFSAPVKAEGISCTGEALNPGAAPSEAASALTAALGGVSLSEATADQIAAAYAAAVASNPSLAGQIASLMSLGRPDQTASIEGAVKGSCPLAAPAILKQIADTAANPTADQLAALAQEEGNAPAAGAEGSP